jgi:uncharacterized membrane protein
MRLYAVLLFLHVLATVIWVGGMFVMHFAVRPSAVEVLAPPQRLPMLAATLRRFFNWVTISVLVTLASGLAMFVGIGMAAGAMGRGENAFLAGLKLAHPSIHAMFFTGLVMMAVYAFIRLAPYPRLQRHVAAQEWPQAAEQLDQIRLLVATNLALGIATIATATVGRALL